MLFSIFAYLTLLLAGIFPQRIGYGIHEGRDFILLSFSALVFFGIFVFISLRPRTLQIIPLDNNRCNATLAYLIALAFLARIILLFADAHTQDLHRYISDGENILQGKNPYVAPVAPNVPYPEYRSFYPAAGQLWFALGALLYPKPVIFRILGGMLEIFFLILLLKNLLSKKKTNHLNSPKRIGLLVFFLLNPLSLHMIWAEGHLDFVAVFPLFFAMRLTFFTEKKNKLDRHIHKTFFFLASGLLKFYGFIFLALAWLPIEKHVRKPTLFLKDQKVLRRYLLAALCVWLALVPVLYFRPESGSQGIHLYLNHWIFGAPLVSFIDLITNNKQQTLLALKLLTLALLILYCALFLLRLMRARTIISLSIITILVLFPVQHAWYYFLLFPLVLYQRRFREYLAGVVILAQLNYLHYLPEKPEYFFFVIWVLPLILPLISAHSGKPAEKHVRQMSP